MPPNKHAHSRSVINSSPSADLFPRQLCTFFPAQRWTSRAWSSPRWRPTAWTASATARRRTNTASKAAPATPATQPHIPTDCSHTTVRTPRGHPSPCQLPIPPPPTAVSQSQNAAHCLHHGGTPRVYSFSPGPPRPGLTRKQMGLECRLRPLTLPHLPKPAPPDTPRPCDPPR